MTFSSAGVGTIVRRPTVLKKTHCQLDFSLSFLWFFFFFFGGGLFGGGFGVFLGYTLSFFLYISQIFPPLMLAFRQGCAFTFVFWRIVRVMHAAFI